MKFFKKTKSDSESDQKGVALLEFAIAFPALLIITFGCVDIGLFLKEYVVIQQAANLGAEKIQTISALDDCGLVVDTCNGGGGSSCPAHTIVRERIESILAFNSAKLRDQCFSFEYRRGPDDGSGTKGSVHVRVRGEYTGTLFHFINAPILSASSEVPYFFENAGA